MNRKLIGICSRAVLATLVALLAVASLAACGSDPTPTPTATPAPQATPTPVPGLLDQLYAAAQQEGGIVWATTDTEERTTAIIGAFEAKYPGVKVSLITANSAELRERLFLEAQAGRITVDVTDPGRDNRVIEEDLAEDLTDIVEELGVDPNLVYSDNRIWLKVGVPHAPICNTDRLPGDEFPQSYADLLDPKFDGEIVVENRLKGFIYLTNLPEYGDSRPGLWEEDDVAEYLSGVKANNLKAQRGNGVVGDLVASGEVSCALEINLSSFQNLWSKGAPLDIVPVETISVEPVHHFVPKNSPNPNAAKLFAAFLMGPEGRALWTEVRPTSDLALAEDTPYANLVKSKGSKIVPPGTELNDHFSRLTDKYLEAIGIPTG
ncbi:MAG: extracellular solute-binding protein [Chloroflexi bacterium]|nr:extracellular solute-binding protein [Chloroflexota bacterium]MYB83500.1 extracellular solute-binding protein [Chloroflexota bacterium]MYK34552.1 extracellular solute-binding protein [Chloroflexota bacterium]